MEAIYFGSLFSGSENEDAVRVSQINAGGFYHIS